MMVKHRSAALMFVLSALLFICPDVVFSKDVEGGETLNVPFDIVYPIPIGAWLSGVFQEYEGEDIFSFEAQKDVEYFIIASPETLDLFEFSLLDQDGASLIEQNDPWDESTQVIQWTCPSAGTYFISVKPFWSIGAYSISIQTSSARLNRVMSLLKSNQCSAALKEQMDLLTLYPDDPEINLYTAMLRIIDKIETPDNRLLNIYQEFGVDFDLFPASAEITNPTDTMMRLSEIQSYAVENILPSVDEALKNLDKVVEQAEVSVFFPPITLEKMLDAEEPPSVEDDMIAAETGWMQIDNADVHVLAGMLLMVKSAILSLNAFDIGVEPKIFVEHFIPNLFDPIMLDSLLIAYPDLLAGKADIQAIFRSALQNWLYGTQHVREGLQRMAVRATPQDVHMFYIGTAGEADVLSRYLSLLDRIFTGLLTVTGGDFNGDSVVNFWDLHELGSVIKLGR
ncbi:MAG: hypothetical protein ACP5I1_11255 [Candidatus Hinthialibacter sp.]